MNKVLLILAMTFSSTLSAEDARLPPLSYCTLDNKDERYACLKTVMDGDIYLAVFAKDGRSVLRVAEIKKNGDQDIIYSWKGCSFWHHCVISEIRDN